MPKSPKTPYQELSDFKKLKKQWHKLSGLRSREEWSAAVVRAVTAAEIATNIVVREEFAARSKFDKKVVDAFLKDANGIQGKVNRLLKALLAARPSEHAAIAKNYRKIEAAVKKRNDIAHAGEFCSAKDARAHIAASKVFVEAMVALHYDDFSLDDPDST
jgi:hypothetical protein